ncbi:MAG: cell division protein FtsQ/DivIB, partial [Solirubrobacterales bacterium]
MNWSAALEAARTRGRVQLPTRSRIDGARARARITGVRRWRPTRRVMLVIVASLIVLLSVSWLLVRNSSLVAVEQVRVVGLSGYYDKAARRALVAEAKTMTTMNVDQAGLTAAVREFVDVADVRVESDLPHRLTIFVDVRRAVAVAKVGGQVVALTNKGLILSEARQLSALPMLDVPGPIAKGHISDAKSRGALTVLGAAPDLLLRRVKNVGWSRDGLVLTLDKNVKLIFGTSKQAAAKWTAATAVLAGSAAKGAKYIDLRVPERPAIGGLGSAPVTPKPEALAPELPPAAV